MKTLALMLALAGVALGQQRDCERVSANTLDCHGITPTRTQLIPPVRYTAPTQARAESYPPMCIPGKVRKIGARHYVCAKDHHLRELKGSK